MCADTTLSKGSPSWGKRDRRFRNTQKLGSSESYGSQFSSQEGAIDAFRAIFRRYADSSIVVSYSSNSLPNKATMLALLREFKKNVDVVPVTYQYSFGNQGHILKNENNKV